VSHFRVPSWFTWCYVQIVSPLVLESLVHAYLLYVYSMASFLSLIQYIGETPSNPKLAKMCMKFNFISICTYLCGVCPIYCSYANYFGPNKFGDQLVLKWVLGTLEMHWMLVSFTREVLSPCAYWSQARIINELLSTTSYQCYLGNKYLLHAYISSSQLVYVAPWHD
jgi:hypothetical protein